MIWLYIVIAVLAIPLVMFVLALIVGRYLRERYEATISYLLDKKPEEVWMALLDFQRNPVTGKMCKKTEALPDVNGLPSWKENIGNSEITVITELSEAPKRLKRRLADSVVPMTADWEVTLEDTGDGTRIVASNVTVIRSGTWHVPIFRVVMTLTNALKMGAKIYARQLAKNLQANLRFE